MATMQEVANLAGVSLSTVSAAINKTKPVSDATRDRIESAMAQLNFRPNMLARGLASNRSRILALTFPAVQEGLGGTALEFVASAAEAARDAGYHLVIWPFLADQAAQMLDLSLAGLADGVIVMEVRSDDARVEALRAAGVPHTLIGRTESPLDNHYVDIDFEQTTEDAVAELANLGHQRIGFINHSERSRRAGYGPTIRALDGYAAAMRRRNLQPATRWCEENPRAGRDAINTLVNEHDLTAVIVMNEQATFGITAALADRGLAVPQDFSVLSIVSSPRMAELIDPPLTTLHAPGAALGRLGVARLVALLDGDLTAQPTLLPCRLVPGASIGPVPIP